jgi:hypothetical protein
MIITYNRNNEGALVLSAFVGEGAGEYLLTRTFYFMTRAQAVKVFRQELKKAS